MFPQFRARYPKGCLTTELITIHDGQFVVKAVVQVEDITLATGLAASSDLEQAEDRARARALQVLGIAGTDVTPTVVVEISPMVDSLPTVKAAGNMGRSTPETVTVRQHPVSSPVVSQSLGSSSPPETTPQSVTLLSRPEEAPLEDVSPLPEMETDPPEPELELEPETLETPPAAPILDVAEIITITTVEMKRLGWTDSQGRDYLMKTYGKKSRYSLNDEELAGFLQYLQTQPTPD